MVKRKYIVKYLVCNVNGLLREMGGRTQRCSQCFRKVENSLGPSQRKEERRMKKRNMKKREEEGLGRGEEERRKRKSIGKKTRENQNKKHRQKTLY